MSSATLTRFRLTLKQHRFEVYSIGLMALIVTAGALFEGLRLNMIHVPKACESQIQWFWQSVQYGGQIGDPDGCLEPSKQYNAITSGFEFNILRLFQYLFPFVAGIALGAPIVAKEVEQGTAPLSWSLSPSRVRWLVTKLLSIVVLVVLLSAAVGAASDFLFAGVNPGLDANASFAEYQLRGPMVVFWAVAAFAGAVAAGTILRRTVPAIVVAMIVCLVVVGGSDAGMRRIILPPFAVAQFDPSKPPQAQNGDISSNLDYRTDLQLYWLTYRQGRQISEAEANQWNQRTMPAFGPDGNPLVDANGQPLGPDGKPLQQPDPAETPYSVGYVIPGSSYWMVIGIEGGLLLGGALLLSGVALFVVNRRRPY